MKTMKLALASSLLVAQAFGLDAAVAQTTDGYHVIQIFPVVVDSPTFTQRFTFRNPNGAPLTIAPSYFPATDTTQASPLNCPTIAVPAYGQTVFTSLRSLCPALATGGQFGFLYTYETHAADTLPFAAYSRVSNFAGNGFSVEAFPAHTFTSADTVVTGIRRLAASGGAPAYQTNCFLGNLNEFTPSGSPATTIIFTLYDSTGAPLGSSTQVSLAPGKLTRLLDVFAAAGVPAGNYNDARIRFSATGTNRPGLLTFCTVQDNTSFGADFRIGKQEQGFGSQYASVGAQDDHVSRSSLMEADVRMSGDVSPRPFSIPAGSYSNTHVMYFRHPDWVQCHLGNPVTLAHIDINYGLEMRLLDDAGNVMAGGNNVIEFLPIYLGDKAERDNGSNTRYTIEVESSDVNAGVARPYFLHCLSGSGHSDGDIVRYNLPGTKF